MKSLACRHLWTAWYALVLLLSCFGLVAAPVTAQGKVYWADTYVDKIRSAGLDGSGAEDVLAAVLADPRGIALDAAAGKIYWTNYGLGVIRRANLDGSEVEDIVNGLDRPYGIELDGATGKIYWTSIGRIQRANLDGSAGEDVVTGLQNSPHRLAVDVAGGRVYWTDFSGKIRRANLDGTGVEDLVTGLVYPSGIALDVAGGKMYWNIDPNDPAIQKIQRANLDGSSIEDVVLNPGGIVNDIALDVEGDKVYWTDAGANRIRRANLDGTDVEDIVTSGLLSPEGLVLDLAASKMYWTDTFTGKIQRADLDGSSVEDLIVAVFAEPESVAVDAKAEKIYWSDPFSDKIQRANLDGTSVEDIIETRGAFRIFQQQKIAIDEVGRKIYWGTGSGIHRANLDGSNIEPVVVGLTDRPKGLAIDSIAQQLYWTEATYDPGQGRWQGYIRRASLDGSDREDIIASSVMYPLGIEVGGGKIYWTDGTADKIQRANLDGTGIEDLVTADVRFPEDIALDLKAAKMYWCEPGRIRRANLDGTQVEDLITEEVVNPRSIAITETRSRIVVEPDTFDFGEIMAHNDSTATLAVTNEGTEDLVVTDIVLVGSDPELFHAEPTSFTLAPSEHQAVAVTFAPQQDGSFSAVLSVESNADTLEVRLTGSAVTGTAVAAEELPAAFVLHGAYPNPFNPTTTVHFDLPEPAEVTLQVIDVLGRVVQRLEAGLLPAGRGRAIRVEAGGLASGVYVYRVMMQTERRVEARTGRFVLVK